MRSSILHALLIIYSILLIFSLIFFSFFKIGEVWSVLSPFWHLFIFWNYCTMRFMSSLNSIWLATIVFSNSWVLICSLEFLYSFPSTMVIDSLDLLWLGLSCKSNMGLRCCNRGVPSIHKGFSIVMGLELELTWLSLLDSLWSLPFDLDQTLP